MRDWWQEIGQWNCYGRCTIDKECTETVDSERIVFDCLIESMITIVSVSNAVLVAVVMLTIAMMWHFVHYIIVRGRSPMSVMWLRQPFMGVELG